MTKYETSLSPDDAMLICQKAVEFAHEKFGLTNQGSSPSGTNWSYKREKDGSVALTFHVAGIKTTKKKEN